MRMPTWCCGCIITVAGARMAFWPPRFSTSGTRENSRAGEAGNRDRVVQRMQGSLVRAERGLAELAGAAGARS